MAKEASANKMISLNFFSTLLVDLIGVVTAPILSRLLGKNGYGIVSIYATWVSIFSAVVGLRAEYSIGNAILDYPQEEQRRYQSSVIFLCSGWSCLLLIIATLARGPAAQLAQLPAWSVPLMVVNAFGTFAVSFLQVKFRYELRPVENLIVTVGTSLSIAVISIILASFLPREIRYVGKVLGTAIPYALVGVVLAVYFIAREKQLVQKAYWKYCLRISLPLVPSGIFSLVLGQSDRLMLQRLISLEAVGVYTLAFNFSNVVGGIWSGLNSAWGPFYYRLEQSGDQETLKKRLKDYTRLFTTLTIGFVLLSPEVFALYGGEEFSGDKWLIPVFVAGFYAQFIYSIAVNYEYYQKKTKKIASISIIAALLNVLLNFCLIPVAGALGAAAATALVHLFNAATHWYIAKRRMDECRPFAVPFAFLVPYILAVAAAILLFLAVPVSFWWIRWALGAGIGIAQLHAIIKRRTIF